MNRRQLGTKTALHARGRCSSVALCTHDVGSSFRLWGNQEIHESIEWRLRPEQWMSSSSGPNRRIAEELWRRHMQWSWLDQIWPQSASGSGSGYALACFGAGAYHMTMTAKWISFGSPKYLCIARIDFDLAAVARSCLRLSVFGSGPRPETWRALFMGSMNQRKSVKQVYDTFLHPPLYRLPPVGFRQAVDILIWQPSMAI